MLQRPFQLLNRDQDLSERSIDFRLSRVKACYRSDGILIVEDEPAEDGGVNQIVLGRDRLGTRLGTHFKSVRKTLLRWLNVVFAHSTCASFALAIALSIPSRVAGLTRPSCRPLAGQ